MTLYGAPRVGPALGRDMGDGGQTSHTPHPALGLLTGRLRCYRPGVHPNPPIPCPPAVGPGRCPAAALPGVFVASRAGGWWGLRVTSCCPPAGPSRPTVRGPRRHPPVLRMVLEALQAGEQRRGTSVAAIKVYILQKYPAVDVLRLKYLLKQALATGMHRGLLVRPTNSRARGATGSFKVSLLGLQSGVRGGHGVGGTGPRSLSFSPCSALPPPGCSPARDLASPSPCFSLCLPCAFLEIPPLPGRVVVGP